MEIKGNKENTGRIIAVLFFILSIVTYHYLISDFFPNKNNSLGHDYSYFLPLLLNGYYWYVNNGIFSIPWFSPAFCGGLPFLPNPQVLYFSLPQLLTLFTDPFASVYITILIFAALGFIGCNQLLQRVFMLSPVSSAFGSTLFVFNGFYLHRMIIGHLSYHSFMLIPFIAYFLLRDGSKSKHEAMRQGILDTIYASLMLAYMINAGAANYFIPALICIFGIWLVVRLQSNSTDYFWWRYTGSCVMALCLSAVKIVAGISLLRNFPRDSYLLPGIQGYTSAIKIVFQMLFFKVSDNTISEKIVNNQFILGDHEFRFGLTFIPLLIIVIWLFFIICKAVKKHYIFDAMVIRRKSLWVVLFGLFLLMPVLLNSYNPSWNTVLKSLPYIKNSSSLFRWIAIYIPVLVIVSSIALDSMVSGKIRFVIVIVCTVAVISINFSEKRTYYQQQEYNPQNVIHAYYQTRETGKVPPITDIDNLPGSEKLIIFLARNDLLTLGKSQLLCYEPVFGYRLEKFPITPLSIDSVMAEKNGYLNFKNPVCYIYPAENHCRPGDHFKSMDKNKLYEITRYRNFNFNFSRPQLFANWINLFAILLLITTVIIIWLVELQHNKKAINPDQGAA